MRNAFEIIYPFFIEIFFTAEKTWFIYYSKFQRISTKEKVYYLILAQTIIYCFYEINFVVRT